MARQKRGANPAEGFPAARPTKKTSSKTSRRKAPNALSATASQPLSFQDSRPKARKVSRQPRSKSSVNDEFNSDFDDAADDDYAASSSSSDDSVIECTPAYTQKSPTQRLDSRLAQSYPTVVNRRPAGSPSIMFPNLRRRNAETETPTRSDDRNTTNSLSTSFSPQSTSQPRSTPQTRSSATNAEGVSNREYFAVTYLVRNGPVNKVLIERGKVLLEELFTGCDVDPTTTSMVSLDD